MHKCITPTAPTQYVKNLENVSTHDPKPVSKIEMNSICYKISEQTIKVANVRSLKHQNLRLTEIWE